MKIHEITINGEIYTVTEDDCGNIVRELKMTDAQKKIISDTRLEKEKEEKEKVWEIIDNLNNEIDAIKDIAEVKIVMKKILGFCI